MPLLTPLHFQGSGKRWKSQSFVELLWSHCDNDKSETNVDLFMYKGAYNAYKGFMFEHTTTNNRNCKIF
jgi:hypothetical protein